MGPGSNKPSPPSPGQTTFSFTAYSRGELKHGQCKFEVLTEARNVNSGADEELHRTDRNVDICSTDSDIEDFTER